MKGGLVIELGSRWIVIACLTAAFSAQTGDLIQQPKDGALPQATKLSLMKVPLIFEQCEKNSAPEVRFVSRGQGYNLFLATNEVVLVLAKGFQASHSESERYGSRQYRQTSADAGKPSSVVRMKMAGANLSPLVTGRDELPSKSHYFIGSNPSHWRTNVSHYGKVGYS